MTPPPSDPEPDTAAPTSRVVIVRGGEPDAVELAALALALTPGRHAAAPAGPPAPPAWARAALLEAVGGSVAVRPSDLDIGGRAPR